MASADNNKADILGVRFDGLRMREALDRISGYIAAGRPARQVTLANAYSVTLCRRNAAFARAVAESDLTLPDGAGVLVASRLLGGGLPERVAGPDLVLAICERASSEGRSLYLFGTTPETNSLLSAALLKRFPGLKIVGSDSPSYFIDRLPEAETSAVIERMRVAAPDILLVGISCPKQEIWIHENRDRIPAAVCLGVGAAFDFLSGRVRRAPAWLGRIGFEWLFRLVCEPRRLWRRYLLGNVEFLSDIAAQLLGRPRIWTFGCAVLAIAAMGIAAASLALPSFVFLFLMAMATAISAWRAPGKWLEATFFLPIIMGAFDDALGVRGVTSFAVLSWAGFTGVYAGRRARLSIPRSFAVWILWTFLSFVTGLVTVFYLTSGGTRGIALPWTDVSVANAVGWVVLGFLNILLGPAFFLTLSNHDGPRANPLSDGVVWALVFGSVAALLQYTLPEIFLSGDIVGRFAAGRAAGAFRDPNVMGLFAAVLAPFALDRLKGARRWAVVAILMGMVVLSGARSAWLCLMVAAVFMTVSSRGGTALALAPLLALLVWQVAFGGRLGDTFTDFNLAGGIVTFLGDRLALWRAGWVTFTHNPFFGTGLGAYLLQMPSYGADIGKLYNDTSCNVVLQILAEGGIVGAAAHAFLAAGVFRGLVRARSAAMTAVIAGVLAAGMFASVFSTPEIWALGWGLLAVSLPVSAKKENTNTAGIDIKMPS